MHPDKPLTKRFSFSTITDETMKLRVFISIPVPNTAGLNPLVRDLKTVRGLKVSNVSQLHITLRFLGDVDEERIDEIGEIVSDTVSDIQKSRLSLKGLGCFPNERNPKVLWVGIDTALPLERIADKLSAKLRKAGIPFDEKPFKPHVTVGRIDGRCNITPMLGKYRTTEFTTCIPSAVYVMKSELKPTGAEHTILRYCELKD